MKISKVQGSPGINNVFKNEEVGNVYEDGHNHHDVESTIHASYIAKPSTSTIAEEFMKLTNPNQIGENYGLIMETFE